MPALFGISGNVRKLIGQFGKPFAFIRLSHLPRYSSSILRSEPFSRRVASRSKSMYLTTNRSCSRLSYSSSVNSSSCLCCGRTLMVLLCNSLTRFICCNNSATFFSIASSTVCPLVPFPVSSEKRLQYSLNERYERCV